MYYVCVYVCICSKAKRVFAICKLIIEQMGELEISALFTIKASGKVMSVSQEEACNKVKISFYQYFVKNK